MKAQIIKCFTLSSALIFLVGASSSERIEQRKITFTALGQKFSGSEILPQGQHPLNQLAKFTHQELDSLPVIYSRSFLEVTRAKGAYSIKDHKLFIPHETMETGELGPVVLHELIHARIWVALRRGLPQVFNGVAYNDDPSFSHRQYGPAFGIDEIVATLFSIRFHARVIESELKKNNQSQELNAFSVVVESVNEIRVYSARLQTMLESLQVGLEHGAISSVDAPEGLEQLPIRWQSITTENIQLYLPESVKKNYLDSMLLYSKNSKKLLTEAESIGAQLQLLTSQSEKKFLNQVRPFLDLVNTTVQLFADQFPKDFQVLISNDGMK